MTISTIKPNGILSTSAREHREMSHKITGPYEAASDV
jgi:hypothetical protein